MEMADGAKRRSRMMEKAPAMMISISRASNIEKKLDTIYEDKDTNGPSKDQKVETFLNESNTAKKALCGMLATKLKLEVQDKKTA